MNTETINIRPAPHLRPFWPAHIALGSWKKTIVQSVSIFDEAHRKLTQTSMIQMAQEWAKDKFSKDKLKKGVKSTERDISNLKKICEKYEFAEQGESADFLITEPITNMVKRFNNEPPRIVSIGSKGSGKTFCYLQIARAGLWSKFVRKVSEKTSIGNFQGFLFPLLHPTNLESPAQAILDKPREEAYKGLGGSNHFLHYDYIDKIIRTVKKNADFDLAQWSEFWLNLFSEAIETGMLTPGIKQFNEYLASFRSTLHFLEPIPI